MLCFNCSSRRQRQAARDELMGARIELGRHVPMTAEDNIYDRAESSEEGEIKKPQEQRFSFVSYYVN